MKATVTCDHVFDILTRGPFPSGADRDADVEAHLETCHDCRQLAEMLRPAVGVFHEAMSRQQQVGLPEFRGRVQTVLAGHRSTASTDDSCRRDPRSKTPYLMALAPLLLLAASATLLWNREDLPRAPAWTRNGVAVDTRLVFFPDLAGQRALAALGMPPDCIPAVSVRDSPSLSIPATSYSQTAHACCSECHTAAVARRPPRSAVAKVSQACMVCHAGPSNASS
jgi:hypothetical protein